MATFNGLHHDSTAIFVPLCYFDEFEYFVGDLIYAGEIYSQALEVLRPFIQTHKPGNVLKEKKVILCTVDGDLHDIGKNIVKYTMEAKGITVVDLGVNVSPSMILAKALEENISVIALSAMLSIAVDSMARTISAFRESGMRKKVKILVGGSCMNQVLADRIGADAYCASPDQSARLCAEWLEKDTECSRKA